MTEIICITCPKGCHLQVDENNDYAVTGHSCPRGEAYGKNELKNPVRTLTSTVRLSGARTPLVSRACRSRAVRRCPRARFSRSCGCWMMSLRQHPSSAARHC